MKAGTIDFSRLHHLRNPKEAKKAEVEEGISDLKHRLTELQKEEDQYNLNAARVPESDPNISNLNDGI